MEIISKLNHQINAALASPVMKARLADLDGTVLPGPPAGLGKLIAADTEKWARGDPGGQYQAAMNRSRRPDIANFYL